MKNKPVIVVRTTPEMANWMHPQTEERKQRIMARAEAAKERVSQRLRAGTKATVIVTPQMKIESSSAPIIPIAKLRPGKKVRAFRLHGRSPRL